jgi:phosphomannomutase
MTLFGTAGIRGPVRETVTPALALSVGRAAGGPDREFVVGRDARETGRALASAVAAGLQSAGSDVRRVGEVPTPALAFASRGRRGVMVTASHNPPADNGLKLFVDGTEYDRDAERRVEAAVEADSPPTDWDRWGGDRRERVLPDYRRAVADYARGVARRLGEGPADDPGAGWTVPDPERPLSDLRVAVDCGTGMAAVATPQVLTDLGAETEAINASPDGYFPARESKPTPESLAEFRAYLAEGETGLGLAHDGDADRLVVLAGDGEVVHEDTVLAVLAERYVRASDAADPVVVTTPNASGRIDERVEAAGGRVARVRLGALHEGIARERSAGGDVVFAGEPWKHVHPAHGTWIDGVASAAVVATLVAAAGDLDALRAPVTERPYRKESVACPDDRKSAAMDAVEVRLPDRLPGSVDTDHGVRVDRDGEWVLVRPSGTEPYLRVYAESDAVEDLVETAVGVVEAAVADAGD